MEIAEKSQGRLLSIFEAGVKKSAERLAAASRGPWSVHLISLDVGSGEKFRSILARDGRECLGVRFSNPGERYLVLFSVDSGRALLKAAAPTYFGSRRLLPSMEQATLAEIANILINGLSGELADRQGMARIISAPSTAWGTKAELYRNFRDSVPGDEMMVNVLIHISSPELAADCTIMLRFDSLNANFLLNPDPDAGFPA